MFSKQFYLSISCLVICLAGPAQANDQDTEIQSIDSGRFIAEVKVTAHRTVQAASYEAEYLSTAEARTSVLEDLALRLQANETATDSKG